MEMYRDRKKRGTELKIIKEVEKGRFESRGFEEKNWKGEKERNKSLSETDSIVDISMLYYYR